MTTLRDSYSHELVTPADLDVTHQEYLDCLTRSLRTAQELGSDGHVGIATPIGERSVYAELEEKP